MSKQTLEQQVIAASVGKWAPGDAFDPEKTPLVQTLDTSDGSFDYYADGTVIEYHASGKITTTIGDGTFPTFDEDPE